ncbi:major capsid protein [Microviridae sp.]|nr:major capsid protein [Microviridae sp.]
MKRNMFNLSHEHKTSVDMGLLIPVMCEEVLPGDTFSHSATALSRVAPLQNPLMHRVELRLHTFYVPNRILWSGWEDFITGKDDVTPKPIITTTGTGSKLLDHLGIPPTIAGLEIDAMPVQAYNLIWNEFYRDQDLQTDRDPLDVSLANCAWQKDYFTIARPQPQQGEPEAIPITGSDAQVNIKGANYTPGVDSVIRAGNVSPEGTQPANAWNATDGTSQLVTALGTGEIAIDDLRRALALQRFAEARMRFGSRYIDYLRYMGVNPTDGRLDRPEYLGGGKQTLSFSEVLATAETTEANVGDMYGHGIAMGKQNHYRKMFEEHGWCITLLSARPKTVYANQLPRKFTRTAAMDYYQKELEVLPWQEVNQREVDAAGDPAQVFGYVPRFEEYRHGVSQVSATLREGTEVDWTMARIFDTPPTLNSSFIECTPTDRIYQDANMPDLIVNVQHNLKAARIVGATATMGTKL